MKKLIMSAVIWGLTAGLSFADGHSVVRMGTEGAYPPWNFVDDNGEIAGFERELGDELCKRAELTCEWVKKRLGQHYSKSCFRKLRHNNCRYVDNR